MAVFGVDISSNNGAVDFGALKRAGVKFVLIRCGYGDNIASQDDSRFFENVRKAQGAGMPYGVYLYSYALNTSQAKSEAAHALRLLRQIDKPAYGVWFDMEDADGYKARNGMPSNDTLVKICEAFCVELETQGYYTGLYGALSWLNNQLDDSRLAKYDKWVAQWNSTCDYAQPYGIWQYTDNLVIGGKRFDGNWAYKDYPSLTGETKKEESELTKAEMEKIANAAVSKGIANLEKRLAQENPTYNTLGEVPDYWREEIRQLMESGVIAGTGGGKLGLTKSECKAAVIVKRAMELKGK